MVGDQGALRLGDLLIQRGMITSEQLSIALRAQHDHGGLLGKHLVLYGFAHRLTIRDAVAAQFGLRVRDLLEYPPDPAVFDIDDPLTLLHRPWLPVARRGSTTLVVTDEVPDAELLREIERSLGTSDIEIQMTTWWDIDQAVTQIYRARLRTLAADSLRIERPIYSAALGIFRWQTLAAWGFLAGLLFMVFVWPGNAVLTIILLGNVLFLTGLIFKVLTSLLGMALVWGRKSPPMTTTADTDLPEYTILVPAFREPNVVAEVIGHMAGMDYPPSKLQILLLLEESDNETIAAAKASSPPQNLKIVVVPEGSPQTKPRACNYGLSLATGERLVIYDAEDVPEPSQLRVVLGAFETLPDNVICVQAPLNYFNAEENILTRMFSLEYSAWFDAMLPGLDATRFPIPLGGTSNHFVTEGLRRVGAWDPYNVTEDADLGLRAEALGYRVSVIHDSGTWEEACSSVPAWIRQRTRWIKGYLVTALVHLRRPWRFVQRFGLRGVFGMAGLIAGTPLMFLAYPLVWIVTVLGATGILQVTGYVPGWLVAASAFNALVGNLLAIAICAVAGFRRHGWRIAAYALLNPFYWFLHSFAAWRALYQLIRSPFRWEKTPHGLVDAHAPPSAQAHPGPG
ncbi:MAG: glycosyltransferase [Candidatus Nanopelagicales bacterium]